MMRHRFGLSASWSLCMVLAAVMLPSGQAVAQEAAAQEAVAQEAVPAPPVASLAGDYVHSEMELVAGIRLNLDGTFQYGLTVGSLDQTARGRWTATGNRIELTSDPKPVAPTITAGKVEPAPGEAFAIRVLAPNGRDVAGVDMLVEFDDGDPLETYTSGGAWSVPAEELRQPRFVTFSMRSYGLQSQRLPLDPRDGTTATFLLEPNDFGVTDFTGSVAEVSGDTLTLYGPMGTMTFARAH